MANYKLSLDVELDAKTPLDAAKKLQDWLRTGSELLYYVQDEYDEIFSVDLGEEDEDAVLPVNDYQPLIEK